MHELGLLMQIARVVEQTAQNNLIESVKHITLEVGSDSGVVPRYLKKLFPVAIDPFPVLRSAELHISMVCGKGLVIKDIGY